MIYGKTTLTNETHTIPVFLTKSRKKRRGPQPNFQYGNVNFGHMVSSKVAAQKSPNMNYEQLFSSVFSCSHGLKNNSKKF